MGGRTNKPAAEGEGHSRSKSTHVFRLPQPEDVLGFWFSGHSMARWFLSDPAFDAEIENLFEPLFEGAAKGALGTWENCADGCLALVILLNQFPRYMYRGKPKSFGYDDAAKAIATSAIDRGLDMELPRERRLFLYLPFMHSENLADQYRSVALIEERLGEPAAIRAARDHLAMIERFGRFPQRNSVLEREATAEEARFMGQNH